MIIVNGKLLEADEPRFYLDDDNICYGCQYYGENGCETKDICIEGQLNDYRLDG
ncbi:hypothetical protein [Clostridium rectalis]|uniref:hypothetical protein n=1 Tax=Clostridium rectalis TaxID=2040295 RepID=UPI0013DDDF36|nr:hypothetical protein [Clostridium rectalis]